MTNLSISYLVIIPQLNSACNYAIIIFIITTQEAANCKVFIVHWRNR